MDTVQTGNNQPLTYHLDLGEIRQRVSPQRGHEETNVGDVERVVSSLAGGALAVMGLAKRSPAGFLIAALGGALVQRGISGRCKVYQSLGINTAEEGRDQIDRSTHNGIHVEKTITVNLPASQVFQFWRNFENLPRFMNHLESVTCIGPNRSHWVAKAPAGRSVEWDAEIINEGENELIAWRSLEGSEVDNAGSVRFTEAPEHRGTEIKVNLRYNPPAGKVGAVVAKLFHEEPSQQISEDLKRLKQVLETGETATSESPRGTCS
jgi:uncharacterized membrane protein